MPKHCEYCHTPFVKDCPVCGAKVCCPACCADTVAALRDAEADLSND